MLKATREFLETCSLDDIAEHLLDRCPAVWMFAIPPSHGSRCVATVIMHADSEEEWNILAEVAAEAMFGEEEEEE